MPPPTSTQPTSSATVCDYYGNISQIDAAFGRLIEHLKALGLYDNTIILYTSDKGSAWDPDHLDHVAESNGWLRGAKAWMYEGGIRVPGIALFPTILEHLGIPLPEDRVIDGCSMLPLLDGQPMIERATPLYWRFDGVAIYP